MAAQDCFPDKCWAAAPRIKFRSLWERTLKPKMKTRSGGGADKPGVRKTNQTPANDKAKSQASRKANKRIRSVAKRKEAIKAAMSPPQRLARELNKAASAEPRSLEELKDAAEKVLAFVQSQQRGGQASDPKSGPAPENTPTEGAGGESPIV